MKPAIRPLRLPTWEAFTRLSPRKRAALFLRWAKTRPATEEYDSVESSDCALARFGHALTGEPCSGGNYSVTGPDGSAQAIPIVPDCETKNPLHGPAAVSQITTFGALVKRLTRYLRLKGCQWRFPAQAPF